MRDIKRRTLLKGLGGSALCLSPIAQLKAIAKPSDHVKLGANGLYHQPWFYESFLDLQEDFDYALSQKKQLILLWEQAGCPYCHRLHEVNLTKPRIKAFMQAHFVVVQLDLKGAREVTHFDGTKLEERELARLFKINFTPTVSFFPATNEALKGKQGADLEAFRLSGYWKPFHFETVLQFVSGHHYKTSNLPRFLDERLKLLKKNGESANVWND